MGLKYLGGAFFIGIPARDLTDEELLEYAGVWAEMQASNPTIRKKNLKQFLIDSGYYKADTGSHANKALLPEHENKSEVSNGS